SGRVPGRAAVNRRTGTLALFPRQPGPVRRSVRPDPDGYLLQLLPGHRVPQPGRMAIACDGDHALAVRATRGSALHRYRGLNMMSGRFFLNAAFTFSVRRSFSTRMTFRLGTSFRLINPCSVTLVPLIETSFNWRHSRRFLRSSSDNVATWY